MGSSLKMIGVALVLAIGLASCGDDESPTVDTSTAGQAGAQDAAVGATDKGGSKGEGGGGADKSGTSGSGASAGDSGPSPPNFKPAPLKVSGGGSEQYVQKGGDNSIQEFGEEADEAELQQAAETVHEYYVARGQGEWARACSLMSDSQAQQLQKLIEQSKPGVSCAFALDALTVDAAPSIERGLTEVDAGSLRFEGDKQAFLIYTGFEGEVFAMPLNKTDGEWRVSALQASQLTS